MNYIKFGKECRQFLSSGNRFEEKYYHFSDIKMKLILKEILKLENTILNGN